MLNFPAQFVTAAQIRKVQDCTDTCPVLSILPMPSQNCNAAHNAQRIIKGILPSGKTTHLCLGACSSGAHSLHIASAC